MSDDLGRELEPELYAELDRMDHNEEQWAAIGEFVKNGDRSGHAYPDPHDADDARNYLVDDDLMGEEVDFELVDDEVESDEPDSDDDNPQCSICMQFVERVTTEEQMCSECWDEHFGADDLQEDYFDDLIDPDA